LLFIWTAAVSSTLADTHGVNYLSVSSNLCQKLSDPMQRHNTLRLRLLDKVTDKPGEQTLAGVRLSKITFWKKK